MPIDYPVGYNDGKRGQPKASGSMCRVSTSHAEAESGAQASDRRVPLLWPRRDGAAVRSQASTRSEHPQGFRTLQVPLRCTAQLVSSDVMMQIFGLQVASTEEHIHALGSACAPTPS